MTRPVHITLRNMGVSPALEQEIRSRAAWLETFYPGIVGCRVLLETPPVGSGLFPTRAEERARDLVLRRRSLFQAGDSRIHVGGPFCASR